MYRSGDGLRNLFWWLRPRRSLIKKYFLFKNKIRTFTCNDQQIIDLLGKVKWGASLRWSFGPNSAWGRIETTTIGKTHPTLYQRNRRGNNILTIHFFIINVVQCIWFVAVNSSSIFIASFQNSLTSWSWPPHWIICNLYVVVASNIEYLFLVFIQVILFWAFLCVWPFHRLWSIAYGP